MHFKRFIGIPLAIVIGNRSTLSIVGSYPKSQIGLGGYRASQSNLQFRIWDAGLVQFQNRFLGILATLVSIPARFI